MSGGSHRYLYRHLEPSELGERISDIRDMAELLDTLDDGEHAAQATRDVVQLLEIASRIATTLERIWHDIEWWQSGDQSRDAIAESLAKFGTYTPGSQS